MNSRLALLVLGLLSLIGLSNLYWSNLSLSQPANRVGKPEDVLKDLPHPVPPFEPPGQSKLEDNPPPRRPDNSQLPPGRLWSRERILGDLSQRGRVKAARLKTMKDAEQEGNLKARFHEVSPARSVWIIDLAYPEGIDTRGGFFKNASVRVVRDAETGDIISTEVSGESTGSPRLPPPGVISTPSDRF